MRLSGNSSAFIFLISGLHLAHIFFGVVVMLVVLVDALKNYRYIDAFVSSLNPAKKTRLQLLVIYWHFVDVLWLLLFLLFLFVHRSV
jgi:cytochrome c oxidase subunit 3